jgi:hypothetical protein
MVKHGIDRYLGMCECGGFEDRRLTCVAVFGEVDGDLAADAAGGSYDEGDGLLGGHFVVVVVVLCDGGGGDDADVDVGVGEDGMDDGSRWVCSAAPCLIDRVSRMTNRC